MDDLACELRYSAIGMAWLLLSTAATLALVTVLPLTGFVRAFLFLYVAATAAKACCLLLEPLSLRLNRSGEIQLRDGTGWCSGQVREGSFVMPWLVVVRWRPSGRRFDRTLILLPGMAPPDDLRKIRVFLRWG
jgi:toxin CptA